MNVESCTGLMPTPAFAAAIKEFLLEQNCINIDDSPITEEQPLRNPKGPLHLKILNNSLMSQKIIEGIKFGNVLQKGGGHDHIVWDRHYADQIREAREKFYALIEQGYTAHLMKEDGNPCNRQMTKFNPNAEEIIMVAPTRAG